MASWVMEKIMEKIVDTGLEYFTGQFRGQTSMEEEELQKLKEIYPEVKRVLAASNQSAIRDQHPDLDRWLWQLRDVVEEAEDLLDEFEYLKHKEQLTQNTEETKGKKLSITSSITESTKSRFHKVGESGLKKDRLKEVVHNLVNVSTDVAKYSHLFESTKQKMLLELNDIRETGASPTNNFIVRCEEMKSIMQWLTNSSNEDQSHITSSKLYKNISLLSIVGHGGVGKTTLSHHAYNNVMENEFDVKMWVCVSTNFDVKRVIADMLEYDKEIKYNSYTLQGCQDSLESKVRARKFLLVLDDIWEDEKDTSKWEKVFGPLAVGNLGSKILVTTRIKSVALMIANVLSCKDHTILRLGGMKEDECLQLLNSVVFTTGEKSDAQQKSVLEQIVRKVLGSPLAAKVIGGLLRDNMNESYWKQILDSDFGSMVHNQNILFPILRLSYMFLPKPFQIIIIKVLGSPLAAKIIGGVLRDNMNESYWKQILDSDFRSMVQNQNILFPILRLSYMFLPKPLQSCFSFCSIFPQDHEFDKDDLIRMWIALNFIQPSSNPKETLEDIGERYFDILVKKAFFEKFQFFDNTHEYYKMHNLLHELAQFVSARECYRVMGDEELSNCETIRHLSVKTDDPEVLRKITKFKKLHSLFLFSDKYKDKAFDDVLYRQDFAEALSEIFKASSSIRLLFIDAGCQVPEAIGDLIHLRYLRFSDAGFQLPRSICTLYHMYFIIYKLQTLIFPFIGEFLPRGMNNLFNLRYVGLPWSILPKMHWIGELHPLQILNNFFVKNEDGYRINELEHMNELCELRIYQLENVKDAEEACSAKFCDKGSLTNLSLHWGNTKGWRNIVHSNLDEEVFNNLQPHNNLKQLAIKAYMGTRSAIWMNNVKFISNLERIELECCLRWQILPPFGQLRFLKSLYLRTMPKVKSIDYGFHKNDENCAFPSLEVLHFEDLDALERLPSSLSSLMNLSLSSIPHLKTLSDLSTTSLRELYIKNLESLDCMPSSLLTFSSLKNLSLSSIPLLESLPDLPPSLEKLSIDNLVSLECLPSSLSNISSLKRLSLERIPLLKSLPVLPPSLEKLSIKNLVSLECLPSSLSTISSLRTLWIKNVPLLQQLPDLPSSLQQLFIWGCHKEFKSRYDKISGFDRDKLARIPRVNIYN